MTTDLFGVPVEAFAIGGGAIVAVGAATTLLRRRRRVRVRLETEDAAMERAAAALPGFSPRAAVLGHDGAAALVSGTGASGDERLALVRAGGRSLAAGVIDWGAVRATGEGIVVETGDRRAGAVPITGVDALDVRRLAPAASPEAIRLAERLAPVPPGDAVGHSD